MNDRHKLSLFSRSLTRLESVCCPRLVVLLLLSAVLFLGLGWKLYSIDRVLKEPGGNAGIVSLELAFTPARANRILNPWAATTHEACADGNLADAPSTACARSSLYWDLPFILAYVLFLVLLFATVLRYLQLPFKDYRRAFAAILLAGLLDVIEDVALLAVLNSVAWFPVLLAGVAATLKFLLLGGVLIALLSLGAYWLFSRAWQSNARQAPEWIKPLERVVENEARYLRGRRELAGLKDDPRFEDAPVGLALSGGGIRSATINLGVIQRLMESGFFKRIDYLATVSGGGYIGTALSSLLASRRHTGFDAQAFEFGEHDQPHFDSEGAAAPFAESPKTPTEKHLRWLNGGDVVAHLRAFGEFLVRRHRVLNRDVLRTIGHLLSGVTSMLLLFAMMIFLIASVLLVLMRLNGGPVPMGLVEGLSVYLSGMRQTSGCDAVAVSLFLGAVSPLLSSVASYTLVRTPDAWFRRDGDSAEEARQYRLLWVVGGALFITGFVLNPLLLHGAGDAGPSLLLPPLFFLGAVLSTAVTYVLMLVAALDRSYFRSGRKHRSYLGALLGLNLYLLAVASGVMLIPYLVGMLNSLESIGSTATTGAGGGLVAVALAWWRKRKADDGVEQLKSWWQRSAVFLHKLVLGVAVAVFIVAVLLLAVIAVVDVLEWLGHAPVSMNGLLLCTSVFGALFLASGYFADFNKLSLHYFYRDRLVEAYMRTEARPRDSYGREQELKRDHGEMRLTQLQGRPGDGNKACLAEGESFVQYRVKSRGELDRFKFWLPPEMEEQRFAGAVTPAPYHLYSTCVNLLTDRDMRFRSRKSDIFIFSRFYCGSSVTGYMDSGVYRMGNTKVARAMTISGAAVDSAIGGDSFFAQSFATTLFNIRLGQWMENPAFRDGKYACWQENRVFWPKYLLMEALGMSDSRRRLVHLSDGGHTGDNLALVPLLQRRCRLIVVVDAEHDPDYTFGSLVNAIRYADVDYGVRIDIDLDGFLPDEQGLTPKHFVTGRIHYPETDHFAASEGVLVVLKSSVTAGDEALIHKFRQIHPNFPQQTTGDQFFSEAQFEAYRKLGRAMAQDLLAEHPELEQGDLNVAE